MPQQQDKFAYLIMAHGQFRLLATLLSLLDDARNDIFLHLDAKVQEPPYEELRAAVRHSGLYFIPQRQDVGWGSSRQTLAEMSLFAEAVAHGPYSRYILMSGVCLPIKSQDAIHRFFSDEQNHGRNFLRFATKQTQSRYERLSRYHFEGRGMFTRLFRRLLYLLPIDRIRGRFPKFSSGQNWCALTHAAAAYLVEKRQEIEQLVKHTVCSDEVYKHVYLLNEPQLNATLDSENRNLWLVDWSVSDRHPAILSMDYLPSLLESPCLFARKFSEEHMDVIEAVVRHVRT